MITLHKYVPFGDSPDMSPFCIKMETYLRMTGRRYVTQVADPRKAPKGKLPFVDVDGKRLADTRFIIAYLEGKGDALDTHLGAKERALLAAVRSMLEEHFYWVSVHFRWKDAQGWERYRPAFDRYAAAMDIPRLALPFMVPFIRRDMLRAMHAQGSGRHEPDELVAIGKEIVDAVAELMGDGPYFFGEKPSTLDATIYAFFAALLHVPVGSPLADHARTRPNVSAYMDRMKARYWSDAPSA